MFTYYIGRSTFSIFKEFPRVAASLVLVVALALAEAPAPTQSRERRRHLATYLLSFRWG